MNVRFAPSARSVAFYNGARPLTCPSCGFMERDCRCAFDHFTTAETAELINRRAENAYYDSIAPMEPVYDDPHF